MTSPRICRHGARGLGERAMLFQPKVSQLKTQEMLMFQLKSKSKTTTTTTNPESYVPAQNRQAGGSSPLIAGGSALCSTQTFHWLGKAPQHQGNQSALFTSNIILIQKHPHRHTQRSIWPNVWAYHDPVHRAPKLTITGSFFHLSRFMPLNSQLCKPTSRPKWFLPHSPSSTVFYFSSLLYSLLHLCLYLKVWHSSGSLPGQSFQWGDLIVHMASTTLCLQMFSFFSGYRNKMQKIGWSPQWKFIFLQLWELEVKVSGPVWSVSGRKPRMACGRLSSGRDSKGARSLWCLFTRALVLSWRIHPDDLLIEAYLPSKSSVPNTITFGVKTAACKFWEDTILPIATDTTKVYVLAKMALMIWIVSPFKFICWSTNFYLKIGPLKR